MNSRGLGWRRTWTTALALMGLAGAGLTACGSMRDPYADVPQLERVWTAPMGQGHGRFTAHTSTEELLIAYEPETTHLSALKLADGSVAWKLSSSEPCAFSEVNAAGLLAVRTGLRSNCDQVLVVDTSSGEEVWSTRVGTGNSFPAEAGRIGLSEKVVSAASECGVDRWEARSGKKLPAVKGSWRHPDLASGCRGAVTSTDLAVVAGPKALVGYDVDTGAKRWSRPEKAPEIGSLRATDPMLAELEIDGIAGLRTIEPATGEIGPVIGRPKGVMSPGPAFVIGDRVVGSYHGVPGLRPDGTYDAAVRAWDPESGEEVASWPGAGRGDYVGIDARGLYMGREVPAGRDGQRTGYWLTRADWSGKPARTVGWVDGGAMNPVLVGDLLIDIGYGELADGSHGRRAAAYKVPEKTTTDPIPRPKPDDEMQWGEEDIRPDPRIDPCAEVGDDVLRELGFAALLARQAPLDCVWTVGSASLSTHVDVMSPDSSGTAVSRARAGMKAARGGMTSPVAIDGLGDEAWASVSERVARGPDRSYEFVDPAASSTEIRIIARQQNVVAHVTFREWPEPEKGTLPPASAARQAGAVAAMKDVVEAAGGELSVPAAASDGPVSRVPDMCDAVAAGVRKVLPGAEPTDLTARGEERLRGCLWSTRRDGYLDSHVQVVAYAVGASPITGADGPTSAKEVFADSTGEMATPRREESWDESAMAEDFESDYADASHYTVRSDNVILAVHINLRDRGQPAASKAAQRIADQAMKAIRR